MVDTEQQKRFVPLESNPDVFNAYLNELGVQGEFSDVWSLDEELLAFLPRPVYALLLVFPVSDAYEQYREGSDASRSLYEGPGNAEDAVWAPQTIGNACGTMALLHALNNVPSDRLGSGLGAKLMRDLKPLSAKERANYLESSEELEHAHALVAGDGVTEAPSADSQVDEHYVCLTRDKHGHLVELDGRRKGPIIHGMLKSDDVLGPQSIELIRSFMAREESPNFSIIALH